MASISQTVENVKNANRGFGENVNRKAVSQAENGLIPDNSFLYVLAFRFRNDPPEMAREKIKRFSGFLDQN